jgi:hypothetical protein
MCLLIREKLKPTSPLMRALYLEKTTLAKDGFIMAGKPEAMPQLMNIAISPTTLPDRSASFLGKRLFSTCAQSHHRVKR